MQKKENKHEPKGARKFLKKVPSGLVIGYVKKIDLRSVQVSSIHRKDPFPGVILEGKHAEKLKDGDVITYRVTLKDFELVEHVGNLSDPHIYALMSLHRHALPYTFPLQALKEAQKGQVPELTENRKDLRDIPFVTIDGEDAKDFDDAVFAEPLDNHQFRIMVAIADVSHYVKLESHLDKEAKLRGNSVYFPNTVVPMLPEALSNNMCSLRPNEDRAALCVDMIINAEGNVLSYTFARCLIRSKERLTYTQVQKAIDGEWTKITLPLQHNILNLYAAYKILKQASTKRGTINLSFDEYKVDFNEDGAPLKIRVDPELVSQHIIEEMMILANVCAAKALSSKKCPTLYRIHEQPEEKGFNHLKDLLKTFGFKVPQSKEVTPHVFNQILKEVEGSDQSPLLQELVLRSQAQAKYSPNNAGHFGLSLTHYAHFTSPIRRYADLVVHRCLVTALGLDQPEVLEPADVLENTAFHISKTERLAATAERETFERFAYQMLKVGDVYEGRIAGLVSAGLFVKLSGLGAEGFIPVSQLADDYYVFEERNFRFVGRRKRAVYQLGQSLTVKIVKSDPLACSMDLIPLVRSKVLADPEKDVKKTYCNKKRNKNRKKNRGTDA